MATLIEVAERIQDLYWQNYSANDSFLNIDDFKFQAATTYSSMLNAMYKMERDRNKQIDGFSNIEIPAAWLVSDKDLVMEYDDKAKYHLVTTKHPVFSFDWDNNANALQDIFGRCDGECSYRKISLSERKFIDILPPTSAVLYVLEESNKIVFYGGKTGNKVTPSYVPSVVGQENDCLLSDNIVAPLVERVLTIMLQARNGTFVQKADNQNPNIIPQQQIDPALK